MSTPPTAPGGYAWPVGQIDALGRFLLDRGLVDGPVEVRQIGDGHSNLTFLVDDGERRLVVRRPPPPPLPPGGHDVLREARVQAALASTAVPVADIYATGAAGEVFDVPFYVMARVDGPVVTSVTPACWATAHRRAAASALVDTLAALHAVDWSAVGLAGYGRPGGFNLRHYQRMAALVARPDGSAAPAFAPVQTWLAAHVPPESGAAVVHGDFRLGNVIFAPGGDTPRVAAVLDWELSTLGDPLLDLGYLLASWPEHGENPTPVQQFAAAALVPGWPTRDDLAHRYHDVTGRSLAHLDWYVTLAHWKLAVLYEYGRRRAVSGDGDPYYRDRSFVPAFLAAAHRSAGL